MVVNSAPSPGSTTGTVSPAAAGTILPPITWPLATRISMACPPALSVESRYPKRKRIVVPAKAGTHVSSDVRKRGSRAGGGMGPRFRGDDKFEEVVALEGRS